MSSTVIVPCAHCDSLNRLPQERLADKPKCGVCGEAVFSAKPIDLTAASYGKQIKGDVPLLVDVWAGWCGPCRQFAPTFSQAAQQLVGQCRFGKIDSEAEQGLSAQLNIRSIPGLILFKGGKEIARQNGAMALPKLLFWLKKYGIGEHGN